MIWKDRTGMFHQSTNPYLAICCLICYMMTKVDEAGEPKCPICFKETK